MDDEIIFDCRGVKVGEVVLFYWDGLREVINHQDYIKRLKQEDKVHVRRQ
jgi:hypothetical protein